MPAFQRRNEKGSRIRDVGDIWEVRPHAREKERRKQAGFWYGCAVEVGVYDMLLREECVSCEKRLKKCAWVVVLYLEMA